MTATMQPASVGGSMTYIHDQGAPAATWLIPHGLGQFPSITVVDSSGREVEGEVDYIDSNTVQLDFSGAFSGRAYLNV